MNYNKELFLDALPHINTVLSHYIKNPNHYRPLSQWFESISANEALLGEMEMEIEAETFERSSDLPKRILVRFITSLKKMERKYKNQIPKTKFNRQIALLSNVLSLNEDEATVFKFVALKTYNEFIIEFYREMGGFHLESHQCIDILSLILKRTPSYIRQLLSPQSKLIANKIIDLSDFNFDNGFFSSLLYSNFETISDLSQNLLTKPPQTDLTVSDFHYVKHINLLEKLFSHLKLNHQVGINILIHGRPGTGKTAFAKALCQQTEFELYAIEDSSEHRSNRFNQLYLVQNILSKSQNTCLLIDEADDILDFQIKKFELNRALESNSIPVIWIMNDISSLDSAYLRRFNYIYEFETPPIKVQKTIWHNILTKHNVTLSDRFLAACVKNYQLPPSFIESAVKTTQIFNGGQKEIQDQIELMIAALDGDFKRPKKVKQSSRKRRCFYPELFNTDLDLIELTSKLKQTKKYNFSLCLYGVSGSGKSAYAEYLANELKLPLIKKSCADILDAYVGHSEKNIKAAFEEAKEKKAILLFDEADSFLQDRSKAVRSWEITQVNQMLTCMEDHPYPFICSTNLMEHLDQASLRRFTFKIHYRYLSDEQISKAFQLFFNLDNVTNINIKTATIGDFIVVKNKISYLGGEDKETLIELLRQEQINKRPLIQTRIGFV